MKRYFLQMAVLTLAMACLLTPVQASPTITPMDTGTPVGDDYLWKYSVTDTGPPAISHWDLGVCAQNFDAIKSSLVPGSVMVDGNPLSEGGGGYEWVHPDPTTGIIGLKFDDGFEEGETKTYSFLLDKNWNIGSFTSAIKAGQNITYQENVPAPGCTEQTPPPNGRVPEPGVLVLLFSGVPALGAMLRRRRH